MYNRMKPPYFSLNIRLLFSDLFRIRFRIWIRIRIRIWIRNVYFGSGSDPDPAKSFGSLRIRIRFRIRNTVFFLFEKTTYPYLKLEQMTFFINGSIMRPAVSTFQKIACKLWFTNVIDLAYVSRRNIGKATFTSTLVETIAFYTCNVHKGRFFEFFFMYEIQHCFICRPSDSTVSEDAVIETETVATTALAVRRSNHWARSHPHIWT